MNTAITCETCGNIFHPDYRYCPFCGNKKEALPSLGRVLDGTFQKIEKVRLKHYLFRLANLEQQLDQMEQELDRLAAERH